MSVFLFAVCHIVFVVDDHLGDYKLWKFVKEIDLLKWNIPDISNPSLPPSISLSFPPSLSPSPSSSSSSSSSSRKLDQQTNDNENCFAIDFTSTEYSPDVGSLFFFYFLYFRLISNHFFLLCYYLLLLLSKIKYFIYL